MRFARIFTGSYTGTGGTGSKTSPLVITVGFKPAILLIFRAQDYYYYIGNLYGVQNVVFSNGIQIFVTGRTRHEVMAGSTDTNATGKAYAIINYDLTPTGIERYMSGSGSSGSKPPEIAEAIQNGSGVKYIFVALG